MSVLIERLDDLFELQAAGPLDRVGPHHHRRVGVKGVAFRIKARRP